ncbi:DUF4184 family protein [Kitasatospora sp. NPDC056327]|uniref:DUF4184 family protein n=1 Tax=Kitasatospora sp. NPDC056327 TaxID=3345785 RepID=UPI0035D72A52
MPFTPSHPAAVLPLLRLAGERGPLVGSALVAGSLAPDVPFFAESLLPGVYRYGGPTHRWWAVPTVDVLLAGALVAGWHGLVRGPLVALLPDRWAGAAEALTVRRAGHGRPSGADLGWFAFSAALGAASHVGWDGFTHRGRFGSRLVPALERPVAGGPPLHEVLQYGTSVPGLAAVAGYAVRAARAVEPVRPAVELSDRARRAGAAVLGAATVAGVVHRLVPLRRGPLAELCFGAGAGLVTGAAGWALSRRAVALRGAPAGAGGRTGAGGAAVPRAARG